MDTDIAGMFVSFRAPAGEVTAHVALAPVMGQLAGTERQARPVWTEPVDGGDQIKGVGVAGEEDPPSFVLKYERDATAVGRCPVLLKGSRRQRGDIRWAERLEIVRRRWCGGLLAARGIESGLLAFRPPHRSQSGQPLGGWGRVGSASGRSRARAVGASHGDPSRPPRRRTPDARRRL